MPLNNSTGNMYPWITHTWNPIRGECGHGCKYCYIRKGRAKRFYQGDPKLIEKELTTHLGKGNVIFVGSAIDMFAENVKNADIMKVLEYCKKFDNEYVFQSKNPSRFSDFIDYNMPPKVMFGTTIESNRLYPVYGEMSHPMWRFKGIMQMQEYRTFVSIEPIMDFDVEELVDWIIKIKPEFVSIGADSKRCGLPEPSGDKVRALIAALRKVTEVRLKSNLGRLMR